MLGGYVTQNPITFEYDVVTLYNPYSITRHDHAGRVVEQIQAVRGSGAATSGALDPEDVPEQGDYVRWTRHLYNVQGQHTSTIIYYDIPYSGDGYLFRNSVSVTYGYDALNRQNSVTNSGGTATVTTFDARGLPLTVSKGARVTVNSIVPNPSRSWQNQNQPFDVNADGVVDLDELDAISGYIAGHGAGTLPEPPISPNVPPPYVDVNGDGSVTIIGDLLAVVNYLQAFYSVPSGDMRLVTSYEYDGGSSTGGKDGNLTQETQHVDSNSASDRVTVYAYDWRNQRISLAGEHDLFVTYEYDNLGRVVRTERWDTDASTAANRLSRQDTLFDDAGRVYQTLRYAVEVGTGTVGNEGDLKTAIVQLFDGSDWVDHETSYYRYYKDSAGGIGFQHGLKYYLGPEAFTRVSGNPFTTADSNLDGVADHYLEYDAQQRVTEHRVGPHAGRDDNVDDVRSPGSTADRLEGGLRKQPLYTNSRPLLAEPDTPDRREQRWVREH